MRTTRQRLTAIMAAGVLSLGLAACGDEGDGGDTGNSEGTAAEAEGDGEGDGEGADDGADEGAEDEGGDAPAEGEEIDPADFVAKLKDHDEATLSSYRMTIDTEVDGTAMTVTGAVDLTGDAPAMRMEMAGGGSEMGGDIEVVVIGADSYTSMPGLIPDGKYLHTEATEAEEAMTEDMNIEEMWQDWEESIDKVVYLGTGDVDGTEMDRYEVTGTMDAIQAEGGIDGAAATATTEPTTQTMQIYLDDEGLMRKIETEDDDTGPVVMIFDGWGESQDIQPPAEADVMTMDEVTQQMNEDLGDLDMDDMDGADSTDG